MQKQEQEQEQEAQAGAALTQRHVESHGRVCHRLSLWHQVGDTLRLFCWRLLVVPPLFLGPGLGVMCFPGWLGTPEY